MFKNEMQGGEQVLVEEIVLAKKITAKQLKVVSAFLSAIIAIQYLVIGVPLLFVVFIGLSIYLLFYLK